MQPLFKLTDLLIFKETYFSLNHFTKVTLGKQEGRRMIITDRGQSRGSVALTHCKSLRGTVPPVEGTTT